MVGRSAVKVTYSFKQLDVRQPSVGSDPVPGGGEGILVGGGRERRAQSAAAPRCSRQDTARRQVETFHCQENKARRQKSIRFCQYTGYEYRYISSIFRTQNESE